MKNAVKKDCTEYSLRIFLPLLIVMVASVWPIRGWTEPTGTVSGWQLTKLIGLATEHLEKLIEQVENMQERLSIEKYMEKQKKREAVEELSALGKQLVELHKVERNLERSAEQFAADPLGTKSIRSDLEYMESQYDKAVESNDLDQIRYWGRLLERMSRYSWLLAGVEESASEEQDSLQTQTAIKDNTATIATVLIQTATRMERENAAFARERAAERSERKEENFDGRAWECFLLARQTHTAAGEKIDQAALRRECNSKGNRYYHPN